MQKLYVLSASDSGGQNGISDSLLNLEDGTKLCHYLRNTHYKQKYLMLQRTSVNVKIDLLDPVLINAVHLM